MIEKGSFDDLPYSRVKYSICKGLSKQLRPRVWKVIANTPSYNVKFSRQVFAQLIEQESKWDVDIKKDIHRTNTTDPFYKKPEFDGQGKLFRVLRAYANVITPIITLGLPRNRLCLGDDFHCRDHYNDFFSLRRRSRQRIHRKRATRSWEGKLYSPVLRNERKKLEKRNVRCSAQDNEHDCPVWRPVEGAIALGLLSILIYRCTSTLGI